MAEVREISANNTVYDIVGKGVDDQNDHTNTLKMWSGTLAEYQQITTPDASTVYIIEDEVIQTSTEVLFDFKFCDHIISNVCWANADNFGWIDGDRYTSAYQHLVDDITGVSPAQETIGSYTITYYLSHDEHRIVLADQLTTVQNIYNETGVAWYYILDTDNHRFKLPRTKYGFVGYRTQVGEYVPAGLPNITGRSYDGLDSNDRSKITTEGVFGLGDNWSGYKMQFSSVTNSADRGSLTFDASRSNSIYGNSNTVQPPATQMLLYFYIGNQVINQDMIDVNAINRELEDKADLDLGNIDNNIDFVIETKAPTAADPTWYRLYKSGWIEQGGYIANNSTTTNVTFLKTMADTNYCITGGLLNGSASATYEHMNFNNLSTSGFSFLTYDSYGVKWEVKGFAAQS